MTKFWRNPFCPPKDLCGISVQTAVVIYTHTHTHTELHMWVVTLFLGLELEKLSSLVTFVFT